jgi:hypothetical protein
MIVNHWTLIDYAYCHALKADKNYLKFIELARLIKSKKIPLSDYELLGLFYGNPLKPSPRVVSQFILGSFTPTDIEFAEAFIRKSKGNLAKQIVGDVFSKLRVSRRVDERVELSTSYFETLIESYNELIESVILHKRKVGELPDIEKRLKSSVEILIKGGFYK